MTIFLGKNTAQLGSFNIYSAFKENRGFEKSHSAVKFYAKSLGKNV